jgi:alanine racemase
MHINLNTLNYNLAHFHQRLKDKTKVMFMIKANAYGCDLKLMSQWIETTELIDYVAVAFVDEGVKLREYGNLHPIMVLNVDESAFQLCQEYNLEPVIYSIELLEQLIAWLDKIKQSMFDLLQDIFDFEY